MFDFDGNGHTDSGEQFIGFQIFRDVTKPFAGGGSSGRNSGGNSGGCRRGSLDGWTVFSLILLGYVILNAICGWIY